MNGSLLKKTLRGLEKNIIISLIFIIFFFYACDPLYRCYLVNTTEKDIFIKISPSIQSFYIDSPWVIDSLNKNTIISEDSFAIYKITKKQEMLIYNTIGTKINDETFKINYMEIYSKDTLILNNKSDIVSLFVEKGKGVYILNLKDFNNK